MTRIIKNCRRALTLVMSVFLSCAPLVSAADYTSANFMIRDSQPEEMGGAATSTSFSSLFSGSDIANTEASSTNFALNSGPMFFETFVGMSQRWRWYDDAENETPTTPLEDEDVSPTNLQSENVIKLRLSVAEKAYIGAGSIKFRLQFSKFSNFSDGGTYVAEEANCGTSSQWCYGSGGGVDNAVISTALLSDPDSCVASVGDGCGTHNESGTTTSSFTHSASTTKEYEFTIQADGATPNTVYFFRAFDTGGNIPVPLSVGHSYPNISTSGTSLSFTIDGIASSTATEGVTTDIDSFPDSVAFGTLGIGTPSTAAHRLTITTNATHGYKIYAFQRQGLLGYAAEEISPVTATNEIPAAWTSACTGGAAGCYGYHSGEDVLAGGSTRFAANDTYAQFTSTPKEVAYNAGPATAKTTDIVYKVEARSLQAADTYESSLVYIVTPVF